ncbi:hypothetical protein E2C01_013648 [Portunus trituberculatus]|uniref:Uncharacterized protein n=1 Tax=Portunus trituberculatus TaxID=210409 RepID=A0A5B7DGT8_PORTR|nr:hypothetical protein [Portunus trituberculatus]
MSGMALSLAGMKSSEELDDMDKDSEFDSEAEDIEFRLYQQLYFEANPDGTEADTERRSPIEEQHEGEVNPNKTHDEQIAQLDGCQLDMLEMKSLTSPHKMPTIAFQNHETQSSQFDNCIYINTEEGTEVALTDYTANIDLGNTEECSIGQKGKVNNNCDPVVPFSDGIPFVKENEISLQSARERLSSTCSDGSIRGSVPLDALYCTLVTSEEEDDTIDSRLILKNIETDDQERIKEKSNKRKRGNISCSDDEEDSRCNNLMSIASKNIVNEGDVQQLEDSNSEDDIHVLPPPKQKNPEVLTLESSSDSEEKVRIRNGTCIKSNNNKYRKIEKPPSSSLKAINEEGNSRSVHQISGIRGELGKKERDVAAGSESDSCDVDMPEATKGTDLTLNIDKRLTGWIKTITKDAPTNKRKIDVTKNPQNKRSCSSVDFTKGRPDTTTKPSCEKWTQSMANFYDSDVSDEFDVSEIHHQQSGRIRLDKTCAVHFITVSHGGGSHKASKPASQ